MNSGEEIMNSGQEHPRLKCLLEGAVREIPVAGKWSRVEVRVRRLRRRRRFLRTGSALLALAVLVPAGLWVRTEIADPGQRLVITDPSGVATGVSLLSPDLTVFLRDAADGAALTKLVASWSEVKSASLVSKEEALARLKEGLKSHPEILDGLVTNPLPASVEIVLYDAGTAPTVEARLRGEPGVDEVRTGSDAMQATLKTLQSPARPLRANGATASPATLKPGVGYTFGGLWAENVETVPARPKSLPEEFFQKPSEVAPALKGEPVWIFANELTPQQVVEAVGAVSDPWRTIVVYQPPVELDAVIDMQGLFHVADIATVPSIFRAEPLLVREKKTFEEVPPMWRLNWADTRDPSYGTDEVAHQRLVYLACASLTLGSGFVEENLLRANPEIATQREEARRTSTTMDRRYPREVEVTSAEAQTLAQRAADHVLAQTGRRFTVARASDTQVIGPGEKVMMTMRHASLAPADAEKATVNLALFRSDEDQLGPDSFLGLGYRFDAGPGSNGVLGMTPGMNAYQAILQLPDGTTVNASSDGLHTTQADVPAPLGPEELIDLARWLATSQEPPK